MAFNILIVDDEPDLEQLIKQKFRREIKEKVLKFSSAYDGLEALNQLENNGHIDLVLTDINMPRMDGLTLLEKLNTRENTNILKTVIISAYGDMQNIRRAMNLGAFDFITKPINFKDLEITIQKTINEIIHIRKAKEIHEKYMKIQNELNIAKNIQRSILPTKTINPQYSKMLEFDVEIIPAGQVGGDFYDYFMIDENLLGFVIGDVAGKGIPASIFMALCKTAIKTLALHEHSVEQCFHVVNNMLVEEYRNDLFVTAFFGTLDVRNGKLQYCNAGHNQTYIKQFDGKVKELPEVEGIPLGFKKDYAYSMGSMTLNSGDVLFMHTDGVNEAMDVDENEFSEKRIIACLEQFSNGSMADLNKTILDEIAEFCGNSGQSDDLTVFSLQYL
ncbi:MAG: SpoIIE family protein phosphatase [Calditrichia bacterium]